ncbi:peptide deformylase [Psychromicrobium xiongbiense]|uniref:peptide deformylase n=1 Tax=Psychromicrobium xiongbiense TaxID=3051184 RepID=UPI0025535B5B|nr:peptide deformylase [Psychromicrobium sp. YIM S02556]
MPDTLKSTVQRLLEESADGTLPSIVQAGHPALRMPSEPWEGQLEPSELTALIDLMRHTMHAAPGVGLAAPQLGLPLQLAVLEDLYPVTEDVATLRERHPLEFFAVLNPHYEPLGSPGEPEDSNPELPGDPAMFYEFYEGCLSVSGWQAVVPRHRRVTLHYTEPDGTLRERTFSGWQARIVQHETDHLAGTLYLDKALLRSLSSNSEYTHRWAHPGIEAARQGLGF